MANNTQKLNQDNKLRREIYHMKVQLRSLHPAKSMNKEIRKIVNVKIYL